MTPMKSGGNLVSMWARAAAAGLLVLVFSACQSCAQDEPASGDDSSVALPGISVEVAHRNQAFLETLARSGRHDLAVVEGALDEWMRIRAFAAKKIDSAPESAAAARAFILKQLLALEPDLARAQAALDEGKSALAAEAFLLIIQDDSPHAFLGAYAALGLAQAMNDLERFEEARALLTSTIATQSIYLSHRAEALFELGQALEGLGLTASASETFAKILDEHSSDAPEAILEYARSKAERSADAGQPTPLDGVRDLMGQSEGRLRETDTGRQTQDVQQRILDELEELIKKAEEAEKSGGGGAASASKSSSPASSASLPGGTGEPKNLRHVGQGDQEDAWGSLPEREREEVIQSLKGRFPARYKELLEQYYKDIQTDE